MSNQYVTITPNVVSTTEFVDFSTTCVIAYTPPPAIVDPYNYVFHDVVVTNLPIWSTIKYTRVSDLSFRVEGRFDDTVDRQFFFINNAGIKESTTRFSLIPNNFEAIYKYVGSSEIQTSFITTMRMRPSTYSYDQIVANKLYSVLHEYSLVFMINTNWQYASTKFSELVISGTLANI